jgi:hypothetical protein
MGLGLPCPSLLAHLAATQRRLARPVTAGSCHTLISIPLMFTMVLLFSVHWDNGWAAIADSSAGDVAVRLRGDIRKNMAIIHGSRKKADL